MRWLTFVLILMYVGMTPVLVHLYPKVSEEYDSYIQFVTSKFRIYEVMCFLFSIVIYLESKDKWVKSLICFLMVLIISSLIDKILFRTNSYLFSDIFLVIIALVASILIYRRHDK